MVASRMRVGCDFGRFGHVSVSSTGVEELLGGSNIFVELHDAVTTAEGRVMQALLSNQHVSEAVDEARL